MKCDELFVYCKTTCDPQGLYYSKSEVDAAIAELKVRNVMFHDEAKYYKAENESLKSKLEDAMATVAFNHLDAVTSERSLRRALWLARALRARDIQRWWIAATCAPATERVCSVWNNVERKCRNKAEEYR